MRLKSRVETTELKPTEIPEGFVLVIDSNEQQPFFSEADCGVPQVRKKLKQGDYSVAGFEERVTIERKKLSDFYGYIGSEYKEKTIKKMKSMLSYSFVALVVEASEEDILAPQLFSEVSPERARAFLNSWRVRYGYHVYLSRSRAKCERFVLDSLVKFYNIMREV